jgi:hypothetical protein
MKIIIETISHGKQRYPSVGDWFYRRGVLHIRVSKLSDWRREYLVALHELVEVMQCRHDGVSQKAVDGFDNAYEKARPAGDESEPGDAAKAPYRRQHCLASGVERIAAAALDVCWKDYEEELNGL